MSRTIISLATNNGKLFGVGKRVSQYNYSEFQVYLITFRLTPVLNISMEAPCYIVQAKNVSTGEDKLFLVPAKSVEYIEYMNEKKETKDVPIELHAPQDSETSEAPQNPETVE